MTPDLDAIVKKLMDDVMLSMPRVPKLNDNILVYADPDKFGTIVIDIVPREDVFLRE